MPQLLQRQEDNSHCARHLYRLPEFMKVYLDAALCALSALMNEVELVFKKSYLLSLRRRGLIFSCVIEIISLLLKRWHEISKEVRNSG